MQNYHTSKASFAACDLVALSLAQRAAEPRGKRAPRIPQPRYFNGESGPCKLRGTFVALHAVPQPDPDRGRPMQRFALEIRSKKGRSRFVFVDPDEPVLLKLPFFFQKWVEVRVVKDEGLWEFEYVIRGYPIDFERKPIKWPLKWPHLPKKKKF
jgi:hypothetical protein